MAGIKDDKVSSRFNELMTSGFKVEIQETKFNSNAQGDIKDKEGNVVGNIVQWNPNGDFDGSGSDKLPADAILAHEMLGHSWQITNNLWSDKTNPNWHPIQIRNSDGWASTQNKQIGNRFTERDATSIENR